jgi:hypothetical protein
MRQITVRYSPLNAPLGCGTDALRQRWSLLSSRNDVDALLEKKDEARKPRLRFARMISSKRRMEGLEGGVVSRSWMNSLKAFWMSVARSLLMKRQDRG